MPNPEKYWPVLHNLPYLCERRRALRRNLTSAEKRVWHMLRGSRLGMRIRRQHSMGNFIVDFYCARRKLIIEIDGKYHEDPLIALYDEYREAWLREQGFEMIRFTNEQVLQMPEVVLAEIDQCLNG